MTTDQPAMRCGCTPVHDSRFEAETSPSGAIVEAVAAVEDVDPTALPPLYDAVDPEAIDRLLTHHDPSDTPLVLSFTLEGWNVFVRSDGAIRVCDPEQSTTSAPVFEQAADD